MDRISLKVFQKTQVNLTSNRDFYRKVSKFPPKRNRAELFPFLEKYNYGDSEKIAGLAKKPMPKEVEIIQITRQPNDN